MLDTRPCMYLSLAVDMEMEMELEMGVADIKSWSSNDTEKSDPHRSRLELPSVGNLSASAPWLC